MTIPESFLVILLHNPPPIISSSNHFHISYFSHQTTLCNFVLHIMLLRSIQESFKVWPRTVLSLFCFISILYPRVWICHNLFLCFPVNGCLGGFQILSYTFRSCYIKLYRIEKYSLLLHSSPTWAANGVSCLFWEIGLFKMIEGNEAYFLLMNNLTKTANALEHF